MDDSDLDFVDVRSKRGPRKAAEPRQAKKAQPMSQASQGEKRRRVKTEAPESKCVSSASASQPAGGTVLLNGASGHGSAAATATAETGIRAKDKVLSRMQQFKWVSPQRMVLRDGGAASPSPAEASDDPRPSGSGLRLPTPDSDEALALRLQQQLDREAAESQSVDLEDGGLFFCQICQRDLSHMTAEGRTQHINRCLDEIEQRPPVPPPPPGVPDCPICGKHFKTQKSRSAHLKRCSSDMGVPPAVLLQALQRQAEETNNTATTSTAQAGGTKRKGAGRPGPQARKKPRKKADPLDEETMVALALSSSLLEQERGMQAERAPRAEATTAASHICAELRWHPDAGKGRGKRRKGAAPRPPPLLLVQDAEAALARLQERVAALLLRGRAPSPPTPTRCPSALPSCSNAAPLWQKSALLDGGGDEGDFYAPELREFITPWVAPKTAVHLPLRPASTTTPVAKSSAVARSSPQVASHSPALSSQPLSVGSQTLRDVVELAEDAMTLTQCGYAHRSQESRASHLHLSGFIVEEQREEQEDLCVSGFLRENAHQKDAQSRLGASHNEPGEVRAPHNNQAVALSRLASDLSAMVNNPQLSDIQMQVDSGEVFFAHSFMVYARCPLLAEMVHESGIGVREEGAPPARRVLVSDVPAEAVSALLRYLYTAEVAAPPSLRPHLLELAARFDLQELQQLCEPHCEEAAAQEERLGERTEQAFMELLQSMWKEEEEEEEEDNDAGPEDTDRGKDEEGHQPADVTLDNRDLNEERVNEEELEEIYEFAATQRKKEEEEMEEDDEDEEEGDSRHPKAYKRASESQQPDRGLDSSYNRLFSQTLGVFHEGDGPSSFHPSSGPPIASPPQPASASFHRTSTPPNTHRPQPTPASFRSASTPPDTHRPQPAPASSKRRGTALLQSSASVLDSPSLSPRPSSSAVVARLPLPGLSPGSATATEERSPAGGKSCGVPRTRQEPELIVLSDSSEDMNVDENPPPSPPAVATATQRYTQVKPQESDRRSGSFGASLEEPRSVGDCSPELSWLILSTPVRPSRTSTSSSSTQTRSSMRRTQLFPESGAASPPCRQRDVESPVFAEPARLSKPHPLLGLSKQDTPLHIRPQPHSLSKPHPLLGLSKQDTPLHIHPQPHSSSTPLHTDASKSAAPLSFSPLHAEKQRSGSREEEAAATSESLDNTEVASFELSLFSTDPPSSSPGGGGLQKPSEGNSAELRGEARAEDGVFEGREESAEAEAAEPSFRQSFMDEPPMAFNDSWGLDACVDPAANPGRFSLRLEDSKGSDPGCRETDAFPSPPPTTFSTPSQPPPPPTIKSPAGPSPKNSLLNSALWDSWEDDDDFLPLSQRLKRPTPKKTPVLSKRRARRSLVPITPTPHFSDMDTPDLKTKLNRFGVRPLPKRQMILKLKEIHHYTHQLLSSDSEEEATQVQQQQQQQQPGAAQTVRFKEPRAPTASTAASAPIRPNQEEEGEEEPLSTSQDSTTSTVASEESERSNPEQCQSSGGDSDGELSASQAGSRLRDRLRAVRAFILADAELYGQILQYRPLVLSHFQQQLKAAGIRLGSAKLMDYLDSQCITFTTAKPGHAAAAAAAPRKARRRPKTAGAKSRAKAAS